MEKNKISQQTTNPTLRVKQREWYFINLENRVLGRSAVQISRVLRGRNSSDFSYNSDLGNHVVVVNAKRVLLTGKKRQGKKYYDHSGYPGGLRERNAGTMISSYPTELIHRVVKGLMPHNRLSRKQLTRLFIYADSTHPHTAQQSNFLTIN